MKGQVKFPRAPLIFALAAASVVWPWLSLPALFFALVGTLILPSAEGHTRQRRFTRLWLAASLALVTIGLTRFVIHYAIVGIVQGGEQAVTGRAVSRLRDILRWELAERRAAAIDPDHDGIGSAWRIAELSGAVPLRSGQSTKPPLERRFKALVDTPIGPASRVGDYFYVVCLPTTDGGWSAKDTSPVDEEAAERAFLAYAWPARENLIAYVIDAKARVFFRDNLGHEADPYIGQLRPVPCNSIVDRAHRGEWIPWTGRDSEARHRASSASRPNGTRPKQRP